MSFIFYFKVLSNKVTGTRVTVLLGNNFLYLYFIFLYLKGFNVIQIVT